MKHLETTQYLAQRMGLTASECEPYRHYCTEPQLGSKPAVVLIDFYVAGIQQEGHTAERAVTHTQTLISLARSRAWPCVWITRDWQSGRPSTLRRPQPYTAAQQTARYSIDPRLDTAQDPIIAKPTASAYTDTDLDLWLDRWQVDSVIYAGHSTAGCVRATVTEGFSRHRPQVIVEECVFCSDDRAHWSNLWDLHHRYAPVISLSELQ